MFQLNYMKIEDVGRAVLRKDEVMIESKLDPWLIKVLLDDCGRSFD